MFFDSFFRRGYYIVFMTAVVILIPYIGITFNPPEISFNQHYIEQLDIDYKAASFGEKLDSFLSYNSYVWNQAFNKRSPENLNLAQPDDVFDYVFSQIPYYSIVYPTEMYYYYKFSSNNISVSGNLRLVEIVNGSLTIGYFDDSGKDILGARKLGREEGVTVREISENLFRISYNGKRAYFRLNNIWDNYPENLAFDSEGFVAKVRDESGIIFYLIFDNETKAFYYILDETRPVTEELEEKGSNLLIGNRTGFAYYSDTATGRKILIGVNALNIILNNYFDGPFDQVPPRLDILDKLHEGYPYTKAVSLDSHGNFLFSDSMRMSISPYTKYYSHYQISELISLCSKKSLTDAELYACLTWEDKRDFHKDSDLFYENGTLKNDSIKVG